MTSSCFKSRKEKGLIGQATACGRVGPDVVLRPAFSVEELERLKAAELEPMPRALIRVRVEGASTLYAQPPMLRNPHLKVGDIPGATE